MGKIVVKIRINLCYVIYFVCEWIYKRFKVFNGIFFNCWFKVIYLYFFFVFMYNGFVFCFFGLRYYLSIESVFWWVCILLELNLIWKFFFFMFGGKGIEIFLVFFYRDNRVK